MPCTKETPCCGPEIGAALREVLRRTLSGSEGYESWNPQKQSDCCDSLIKIPFDRLQLIDFGEINALNSWDVENLFSDDLGQLLGHTAKFGCASHHPCEQTVMVDGQCHKAWAVNYVAFGYMMRICRYRYPLDLLRTTTIFNTEIPVKKSLRYQYRAGLFGISKLVDLVGGYKTLKAYISPNQGYKLGDVDAALEWAQVRVFQSWTMGATWPMAMVA